MKFFIIAIFVALATALPDKSSVRANFYRNTLDSFSPKVIGGEDAVRYQFPYQVSIRWNISGTVSHLCGGGLIDTRWVLTAAHCHLVEDASIYDVVLGLLNQGESHEDIQIIPVEDFIIYPGHPGGPHFAPHDIALIKLAQPAKITRAVQISPLPLDRDCDALEDAYLSGWGETTWTSGSTPVTLQWAKLPRISHKQCAHDIDVAWGDPNDLDNTTLCTGQNEGPIQSLCPGDSGGPLVLASTGSVIGVVSWSLTPCGVDKSPSMYTDVCLHRDFIDKYVKQ